MRINGEWMKCEDGVCRPMLRVEVLADDGSQYAEHFLVDSGADCTALRAELQRKLGLPEKSAPAGIDVSGIGGASSFVVVKTTLELACDDGVPVHFSGEIAALTSPQASDLSILGRDILDQFDVILSKPRDEVVLLSQHHHYQIIRN